MLAPRCTGISARSAGNLIITLFTVLDLILNLANALPSSRQSLWTLLILRKPQAAMSEDLYSFSMAFVRCTVSHQGSTEGLSGER